MDASGNHGSAKIYQFPQDRSSRPGNGLPEMQSPTIIGGAWYHEDAINEAKRDAPSSAVILPLTFPRH